MIQVNTVSKRLYLNSLVTYAINQFKYYSESYALIRFYLMSCYLWELKSYFQFVRKLRRTDAKDSYLRARMKINTHLYLPPKGKGCIVEQIYPKPFNMSDVIRSLEILRKKQKKLYKITKRNKKQNNKKISFFY